MNYSNQNIDKIKELITTTQNNLQNLPPEEKSKLYKDFADFLKKEGNQAYLKHYPIFQKDFPNSDTSLFERLNNLIDLDHNQLDNYINDLINKNGTDYSKIWNESLKSLLDQLKVLLNDNYKICDVWKQQDAKDANAGRNFIKNSTNSVVVPNENIEKQKYLNVRGNDKEEKALYNRNNLQFTHHQNNDDIANRYIRLLMDKYSRNVEVEDLNRNFWVIGQVISIISGFLFEKDSPINQLFKKISSETVQLWENLIYLWAQTAILCQHKDYPIRTEIIYLPNNNSQNYRKFDNFSLNTNQDLIDKINYLKSIYTENSLIVVPIIREDNNITNLYGSETYLGYYYYNRNINEESFQNFSQPLSINLEEKIQISSGVYLNNEPLKKYLIHLYNDKSNLEYIFKYGDTPIKDKEIYEEYYLRIIPSINLNQENDNFGNLTLQFYDAVRYTLPNEKNNSSFGTIVITNNSIDFSNFHILNPTNVDKITYDNINHIKDNQSAKFLKYYEGEIISGGGSNDFIPNLSVEYQFQGLRPISPSQYQIDQLPDQFTFDNINREDGIVIGFEKQRLKNLESNKDKIEMFIYGHPSYLGIFNQEYSFDDVNNSLKNILIPKDNSSRTEITNSYLTWEATGTLSLNVMDNDYPRFGGTKIDQRVSENDTDEFFNYTAVMTGLTIYDKLTAKKHTPKISGDVTNMLDLTSAYESDLFTINPAEYYKGYMKGNPRAVLFLDNGDSKYNESEFIDSSPNQNYPGAMGYIGSILDEQSGTLYENQVIRKTPRYKESHETIYKKALLKIPRKDKNLVYEIPYDTLRNSTLQAHIIANLQFNPEFNNNVLQPITNYVGAGHRTREYNNLVFYKHKTDKNIFAIKITYINMEFGIDIQGAFVDKINSNDQDVVPTKTWITSDFDSQGYYYSSVDTSIDPINHELVKSSSQLTVPEITVKFPTLYKGLNFKNLPINSQGNTFHWFNINEDKSYYNYNTAPFMPICYRGWNMVSSLYPVWGDISDTKSDIINQINSNTTSFANLPTTPEDVQDKIRKQVFLQVIEELYNNNSITQRQYIPLLGKPTLVSSKVGYDFVYRLPNMCTGQFEANDETEFFKMTSQMRNDITNKNVANWIVENLSEGTKYNGSGQLEFPGVTLSIFTSYIIFDQNSENNYISASSELSRINNDRTLNFQSYEDNKNIYYLSWKKNFQINNNSSFIVPAISSERNAITLNGRSNQMDFENTLKNYFNIDVAKGDFVNNKGKLVFDFSKYPSNGHCPCDLLEPTGDEGIYTAGNGNIKPQDNSTPTINT